MENLFAQLEAHRQRLESQRTREEQASAQASAQKHQDNLQQAREFIKRAIAESTAEEFFKRTISRSYAFGHISTIDPEYRSGIRFRENPFTPEVIGVLKGDYAALGGSLDIGVHDDWGAIRVFICIKWTGA